MLTPSLVQFLLGLVRGFIFYESVSYLFLLGFAGTIDVDTNRTTIGENVMEAAIKKYTNPIDKDVIRDAILTKAIVEYPNEYDWLRRGGIEKWLFGSHEMLYHLLNHITWEESHELEKTYTRFLAAKTEKTRQKHLNILVDSIFGYLTIVFTADNYQILVENKEQLEDLIGRGISVRGNQRVLDDLNALLGAPLWESVLDKD